MTMRVTGGEGRGRTGWGVELLEEEVDGVAWACDDKRLHHGLEELVDLVLLHVPFELSLVPKLLLLQHI